MDRRSFIRNAALGGAAAAASSLAAPAIAQGKRKLTMVTSWPRGFAGVWDAAEVTANAITQITDGTLEIEVKAAGELVGAFEVFDAVSSGQADMYHAADYYFVNKHPAFQFFTALPFGMVATEFNAWYYHGNGQKLHDELAGIFNLKPFIAGNTGLQAGGWFRKEIKSPDDFKGLKFRMPGFGGKVLSELGVSIQNLPGGEIYQALASGAIDGTEWIGPWADEKAGFQEITKIYYAAGMHEPSASLSVTTNLDVWNSLSPAHQKAIETAAGYANIWSLAQFQMNNGAALRRLKAEGVKVLQFPDSVWEAMGEAAKKVISGYLSDDLFKKIYDDYVPAMKDISGWLSVSEGVYVKQRDRVMSDM